MYGCLHTPAGRVALPEEFAVGIVVSLPNDASFVTRSVLVVAGGLTLVL